MSETKHTPTPWVLRGYGWLRGPDGETIIFYTRDDDGLHDNTDGACLDFIVRAVNAHDAMLAALKNAVEFFRVRDNSKLPDDIKAAFTEAFRNDPVCQEMLAAIALAEPPTTQGDES